MAAKRYVIIGDGAAGTTAAQYLRQADSSATIAILSDDPHAAYFRAALTNYLLGELRSEQIFAVPPTFYEELRIHRTLTRVSQVDTAQSQVCLAQGGRLPYDALVIASGSRARTPTFDGWWHPGIMTMRTLQDVTKVMDLVQQRMIKSTVLCGGGPLALEWAHGLSHRGVKVTMVVRETRFLPTAIDSVASDLLLARLRRAGVDVRMGDEVQAAAAGPNGRVHGVVLKSGAQIGCELVAAAIGVICNTEFLAGSEIKLAPNAGVEVNAQMRTNIPNVYAAGDVAAFGGKLLQLWEPARLQGRIAASTIMGQPATYAPGAHYMATRLYDLDCASIGEVGGAVQPAGTTEDLVEFPQGTGKISYRKLCIRDNRLVGALMFGEREAKVRRLGRAFKKLIDSKLDIRPIKDDLLDPAFDLPAWLNTNALTDKPREDASPGGGAAAAKKVPAGTRMRAAKSLMMMDLPPLPQLAGAIAAAQAGAGGSGAGAGAGAPAAPAQGTEVFQAFADATPPPVVSLETPRGRVVVSGTSAIIGRDPQCAITIEDRMVSSAHAEITILGQSTYIRDLGSSHGTWVGGTAVTTPRKLKHGDKIRIGVTELTMLIEAAGGGVLGRSSVDALAMSAAPWAGALAPYLEVRSGRAFGLSFELVRSPTTIGRDPSATVRLDDEWIDFAHASLRKGNAGWEVADAESHGVTKRNGVVLTPNVWVPIAPGDIIEVGEVQLAYVMKQASLPGQLGAVAGSGRVSERQPAPVVQPAPEAFTPNPALMESAARSSSRKAVAIPAFSASQIGMTPASAPVVSPRARARLWIRNGPGQGGSAELTADVTVVGNVAGQAALVVPDPLLAPKHVEIARLADGFYVKDLGTQSGTMCRGQRLGPQPLKLVHGDVLFLGSNVALQFEVSQ